MWGNKMISLKGRRGTMALRVPTRGVPVKSCFFSSGIAFPYTSSKTKRPAHGEKIGDGHYEAQSLLISKTFLLMKYVLGILEQ
jgi:hypothetical protein